MSVSGKKACPGNKLEVKVLDGSQALSSADVRVLLTNPYEGMVGAAVTDAAGSATFTLSKTGEYEVQVVKSGYATTTEKVSFSLCSAETASYAPGLTTTPQPTTTPVANATTTQPTTTPATTTTSMSNSQLEISSAELVITAAKTAGKDVTVAESKLEEAKEALNAGNYAKAETLAKEATTLAQNAQAPATSTTPSTSTTPTPTTTPIGPKKDTGLLAGLGILGLLVIVIVVALVAAVAYYFLAMKKKKR
jgi:hypothetical protein